MSDIKKLPIIMCSMSRWDGDLSSAAYSIAKELSKTNKVFYIDYPYTVKDYLMEKELPTVKRRKEAILKGKNIYTKVPGLPDNFIAVTPKLMIPINSLPEGILYNVLSKRNNHKFFKTVQRILDDHNIKEYIFFNSFNPFYGVTLTKGINPEIFIYQSRDDLRAVKELHHGIAGERKAIKNADILMTTSTNLKKVLEADGGKNVHILPNAAQTDLFKTVQTEKFELPQELAGNTKPVVGYVGHIGLRIDFELLTKVIKAHPDKLFLMVGPGDYTPFTAENYHEYPNVVFAGPKKLAELPRYLHFMDVTIIPFLKNDLTKSIYPLKMNEYLAAGKAIVTTDFSVDVESFKDVAYVSKNHDEFVNDISEAMVSNSNENVKRRVQTSEGNAWSDRIDLFWEILENTKIER